MSNVKTEVVTEEERRQYLAEMEAIIAEYGWFIQGVLDEKWLYAYTIGREDSGKQEVYMRAKSEELFQALNHACQMFDKGEIELEKEFHIKGFWYGTCEEDRKPTVFMLTNRLRSPEEPTIKGIYTRNHKLGRETAPVLELAMGDHLNRLPWELRERAPHELATTI